MQRLRHIIHPFEILYLAIAIATFEHTAWAAAYMFEGPMPEGGELQWRLRGALIAIAVDVGMLMTSRFLVGAQGRQRIVLTMGFIIAALTSFYFQIMYMAIHTPVVTISEGVSSEWSSILRTLIDARVLILPLALPVLATVYTIARLSHVPPKVAAQQAAPAHEKQTLKITRPEDPTRLLEGAFRMDDSGLAFVDTRSGKQYGPYKTQRAMQSAMVQVIKRLPASTTTETSIESVSSSL